MIHTKTFLAYSVNREKVKGVFYYACGKVYL